jgi:FtsP/CotA-like multicopper oxidase with cupredoxin domain
VLAPGERLDVLIKANQAAKNYRLLSLPYNRGVGKGGQVTLMTLSYKGSAAGDALPAVVNPYAERISVDPEITERIALSMDKGEGRINGISFDGAEAFTIDSEVGTHEVWEIVNRSGMDHPFHLHVNSCQVISVTGGDQVYDVLRQNTRAKGHCHVPRWEAPDPRAGSDFLA